MNLTGTISSRPDAKGNVTVQMGILRSQVNISDLEIIEEPSPYTSKKLNHSSKGRIGMGKSLSVSPEINLLGKNCGRGSIRAGQTISTTRCSLISTQYASSMEKEPGAPSGKASTNICAARNTSNPTISPNLGQGDGRRHNRGAQIAGHIFSDIFPRQDVITFVIHTLCHLKEV